MITGFLAVSLFICPINTHNRRIDHSNVHTIMVMVPFISLFYLLFFDLTHIIFNFVNKIFIGLYCYLFYYPYFLFYYFPNWRIRLNTNFELKTILKLNSFFHLGFFLKNNSPFSSHSNIISEFLCISSKHVLKGLSKRIILLFRKCQNCQQNP